ncbi:MAG: hypothetical protein ACO3EH_00505 [Ilumatobacteraceae bacterium]
MSTNASPQTPVDTPDVTHRTAAEKFFQAPATADEPTNDAPAPDTAPTTTAPGETPSKIDPLASVLKTAQKTAPATPTPEPTVDDVDKGLQAPPENAKSRAGWDELKKRANEERKLRLELEQKLKSSPTTSTVDEATKARLAELEQQNKTYSEKLKVFDLKNHPDFVAKYVEPANAAKAALESIATTDEVEVNVAELLSLKGKALNRAVSEAMDQMTPYARVKFQSALDSYFSTQMNAEQALAQADQTLQSMRQTGGARSRASFDEVAQKYSGAFLPATVDEKAPDAAAVAYNAALAAIGAQAETYAFGQIDERGVADLSHKAALYEFTMQHGIPRIASLYGAELSARDAKIAELETQVKALTVANPSISSGSGATPSENSSPSSESHLQAAGRYFQR